MIVVSGCPRSGTSLMTLCMIAALGEDRIIGEKYPHEKKFKEMYKQHKNETDAQFTARMYYTNKYPENSPEVNEKTKDMNPHGFWECAYTVRGIRYNPATKDLMQKIRSEDPNKQYVMKVVSGGLLRSDPECIKKVILMLRHPREVAKSQERLKRSQKFKLKDGRIVDLYENMKIHSPEFFITETISIARWIKQNPEIDLHIVKFEELITKPRETLTEVMEFIGEGDLENAVCQVEPKLYRSHPEDKPEELWEDSEKLYNHLAEREFDKIVEYGDDPTTVLSRRKMSWVCVRARINTLEAHCKACKTNPEFRKSLLDRANANDWDWQNEPCIFECGYDQDNEPLTIEESIKNNFWLDQ